MAKKTVSKKIVKVKKTAGKKIQTAAKKTLKSNKVKAAKPLRKKLGKGLEDISTLFLSEIKKSAATAKKKVVKSSAKKAVEPVKVKSVKNKEKATAVKKSVSSVAKKKIVKKKIVAKKTLAKSIKKSNVSKAKGLSKVVKEVNKKISKAKSSKPNKAISEVLKKTVVVEENVPKKTVAKIAKKAAVVKGRVSKKTTALSDKKTALKEKKVAEKKLKAKKAYSNPIMKKTEVVRMGTLKKSSQEDKKPIRAKATVKKTVKSKSGSNKAADLGPISELKTLLNKKKTAKQTVDKHGILVEQVIGDSKFYVSKATVDRLKEDDFLELPEGYGDNRIVIQIRDPYWVFAYWEVSQRKLRSVIEKFGNSVNSAKRVLRVYDITSVSFNGNNANGFFDIDVDGSAKNWYINVGTPGRSYCIDIGLVMSDGQFVILARSNFVTTPIDAPSLVTDEEWMIVEEDFNKLYGLSAGLGVGLSSGELRKQIKTRLKNLSSGVLSSPGVVSVRPKRDFWMVVNTELIVYGATQPGSQLSVQGKPIELNEDGTFSLRFALPDGEQVISVRAISPDKVEERVITPVVKKNTV